MGSGRVPAGSRRCDWPAATCLITRLMISTIANAATNADELSIGMSRRWQARPGAQMCQICAACRMGPQRQPGAQNGGYLRTGRGPQAITQRGPPCGSVFRPIADSAFYHCRCSGCREPFRSASYERLRLWWRRPRLAAVWPLAVGSAAGSALNTTGSYSVALRAGAGAAYHGCRPAAGSAFARPRALPR